jgi:1-acyl-sn-glycerol-3-phosphate acyltransferase
MLRALIMAGITFVYTLAVGTPLLIFGLLSGNTDPLYNAGLRGVRVLMALAGIKVEVRGREHIFRSGPAVYMPNHQSYLDSPAMLICLPPVLFLGKEEFFRIPVLGRAMILRGFIPVDRRNHMRAIGAIDRAAQSLVSGKSLMVFPEGTRSRDGRLQALKKGVFVMAIKAGAPIVPVSISGSRNRMPKDKFAITPGLIRVTFHPPILTRGSTMDDRDRIMEAAKEAIQSGLVPQEQPADQ